MTTRPRRGPGSPRPRRADSGRLRVAPGVVLALLLAGSAVVTFVFWRQVSFGRRLDDAELAAVLTADSPPRQAQHGIVEFTERFREGRPGMDRWVERLVAVSRRDEAIVRRAAAWAMQFAVADPAVVARLREIVADDPDPTARRDAACSLAFSKDPAPARDVLRRMLLPWTVTAPAAGTVESLAGVGRRPREDEMVCRLRGPTGERVEVVTRVPGRVRSVETEVGATVAAGAPLVVLAPDPGHVLAAAAALAAAGTPDDVPLLRALMEPGAEMPADAVRQVMAAIDAIERRAR